MCSMPLEATGAPRTEWRCMRRLNLLTALPLVLAACSGGAGGATGTGGAGVGGRADAGDGPLGETSGATGTPGTGGGTAGSAGSGASAGAVGSAGAIGGAGTSGGGGTGAGGLGGMLGTAGAGAPSDGGDRIDAGELPIDSGAQPIDAGAWPLDGGGAIQSLRLSTNDLVFDSTRGVLYATMNTAADAGNGVITIDPASATVTGTFAVGGLPSVLAISNDCSALYVGINTPAGPPTPTPQIDGADSVRRIDLASKTFGPAVSLGSNDISKLSAGQIAAVPGSSTQYMVSLRQPGFQPDYAGLALYDATTLLTELSSFYGSGDSIAFIDHSTLIGCSNLQSPSELNRFSVTSI